MNTRSDNPAPFDARRRNLRRRNLALGLAIGFLAVLFYAIAIVKLGPEALRPL